MINSRSLNDLHPRVSVLAQSFIMACAKEKIDVLVTSTYRDLEAQHALYQRGRSLPGAKVTNADAGHSFHNYRLAFDFVPLLGGKADYRDRALFGRCGEIAESLGLEWAGRWRRFPELAHCQFTGGLTLADLLGGQRLPGSAVCG